MNQIAVHMKARVNASAIRKEKRNGRDVIVVPSATLPDDVVMNRVRYPEAVIANHYQTLVNTPAPLGHPQDENGGFISASAPGGIIANFIGAWNENVQRRDGRVFVDKVIDVAYAKNSEGGRRVLDAIEKGKPIHTSTGLIAATKKLQNDADADEEVESFIIDHDAILLDEDGAATPEQGVGMLVNGKKLDVVNVSVEEVGDRQLDYALEEVARAMAVKQQAPILKRMKESLLSLFQTGEDGALEQETNEEADMAVTDEAFAALQKKVDERDERWGEMIERLDTITTRLDAIESGAKANEEAETDDLRKKVVENGDLTEEEAKEAPKGVLNALLRKATPKHAAPIHGAYVNRRKAADTAYEFPSEE